MTLLSQRVAKFRATPMLVAAVLQFIALCAIIFHRPGCADFSKQLRLQHITPYLHVHMSCPIAIVSFFLAVPIYLFLEALGRYYFEARFSDTLLDSAVHRYMTVGKCLFFRTVCIDHWLFYKKEKGKMHKEREPTCCLP